MLQARISALAKNAEERKMQEKGIMSTLARFTSGLYTELENIIQAATKQGAPDIGNINKRSLGGGLESLSFNWGRYRIVISPIVTSAMLDSSYKIPPAPLADLVDNTFANEPVGRVIVFFQHKNNTSVSNPLGEIYVSASEDWFSTGVVFHNQIGQSFDSESLGLLALSILEVPLHITNIHQVLSNIKFDPESQDAKNPIGFQA